LESFVLKGWGQPDGQVQQEINQTANYSYGFKLEWGVVPKISPYKIS
jgi:hypothetical protein